MFGVEATVVKADTAGDLAALLGEVTRESVFDAVVLIAHGSEDGVALASDRELVDWTELIEWLQPLEPQRLALISCKAGRTLAARVLFSGLESLVEVFASPLNMNLLDSQTIDFLMPALLDPHLDGRYIDAVQALQPFITGGMFFRRTRWGHDESDQLTDLLSTLVEEHVVPGLLDAVDDLMSRRRRRRLPAA